MGDGGVSEENDKVPMPAPKGWAMEAHDLFAQWQERRGPDNQYVSGKPHISRLLAFAKAVRAQPEIWGPCIVEAERRRSEVYDPNSELRLSGYISQDEILDESYGPNTIADNYILEWHKFIHFVDWFMLKSGYYDDDDPSCYRNVQFILRKWHRGDIAEDDDEAFVAWFKRGTASGAVFDDEGQS
jgi:hypothetical protein